MGLVWTKYKKKQQQKQQQWSRTFNMITELQFTLESELATVVKIKF